VAPDDRLGLGNDFGVLDLFPAVELEQLGEG
jgi:hypothetical protein